MNRRPPIFLSYARDDDEDFVKRLHATLTEEGFSVWWDRVSMPGRSLTFLHEIREAIDGVDRVLVIVGPAAVRSDYVRAEWQYALTAEKVVTPVLRCGDRSLLRNRAAELAKLHCPDARPTRAWSEALEEILRIVREPPPTLGRLYDVPIPPPHYLPRPDQLTELAEPFLLEEPGDISLAPEKRTVVLHGMGGVGKSVLAAALGRSTQTRRLFKDGVVWLTFGPEGDVLGNLQRAGRALQDDPSHYTIVEDATAQLRKRLEASDSLLILDNVWQDDQAHPFRSVLGPSCRMLITAHDFGLAVRLGGHSISLDPLSEDEAIRHLADWVGSSFEDLPPVAHEVAEECGKLPFALALAGAMAEGGAAWEDLLGSLREADLEYMDVIFPFPDYPYTDLLRMLKVSVDALQESDSEKLREAARRYMEIAAFRWEQPVVENALVTLWMSSGRLKERQARQVLSILASKALLRTEGHSPDRKVYLHDLQQDYLVAAVKAANYDLSTEHVAILDAYANRYPGAPFADIDDGYYFDHLFYHLEHAGRTQEMHEYLRRETPEGHNAWWEVRIRRGQAFGYVADIQRAWKHEDQVAKAELEGLSARVVALQARYALMIGSVRTSLTEVPLELVKRLLSQGMWTPAQALAQARWMPTRRLRVDPLMAVLPFLQEIEKREVAEDALRLASDLTPDDGRTSCLLELTPHLSGTRRAQVFKEVLDLASKELPSNRIRLFLRAWQLYPDREDLVDEAICNIEERDDARSQSFEIKFLASVVPYPKINDLLRLAREIADLRSRAEALAAIAESLATPENAVVAEEASDLADKLEDSRDGVVLLARTVRFLHSPKREAIAERVMSSVEVLRAPGDRIAALADVIPYLNEALCFPAEGRPIAVVSASPRHR